MIKLYFKYSIVKKNVLVVIHYTYCQIKGSCCTFYSRFFNIWRLNLKASLGIPSKASFWDEFIHGVGCYVIWHERWKHINIHFDYLQICYAFNSASLNLIFEHACFKHKTPLICISQQPYFGQYRTITKAIILNLHYWMSKWLLMILIICMLFNLM